MGIQIDYTIFFVAIIIVLGSAVWYLYKILAVLRAVQGTLTLIHLSIMGVNPMDSVLKGIFKVNEPGGADNESTAEKTP